MRRAALLLLATLSLTACAEEDERNPDKQRQAIREVLEELDQVEREGNAEKACEELYLVQEPSEAAREKAKAKQAGESESESESEREAEQEAEREAEGEGAESPAACRQAFEQGRATQRAQAKSVSTEVGRISLEGEYATAEVRATVVRTDGSSFSNVFERELVRRGERWRIRISPEG